MRKTLILFLIISFMLHLLFISSLDLSPDIPKKDDPVSVSIIQKEKDPEPKPEPEPEQKQKKPQKVYEDIPLNEEIETDLGQDTPVPAEKTPDEPESEKEQEPDNTPKKKVKSDKNEIEPGRERVGVPKVKAPEKTLSKEELNEKLLPDDIIQKYAEGGGMPEGEDYVSMQYVKLRYQSYFYKFARRLYQVWIYPRDAALRGEQGTARITFSISKDGMISGIRVVESSGYPDLDREAVTALKKTAGVPLPESYNLNFLKVDAYFKYVMNEGFYVY